MQKKKCEEVRRKAELSYCHSWSHASKGMNTYWNLIAYKYASKDTS